MCSTIHKYDFNPWAILCVMTHEIIYLPTLESNILVWEVTNYFHHKDIKPFAEMC